ncbi:MAG: PAS domain S-box protein, partial [Bacteroidota bacterium]
MPESSVIELVKKPPNKELVGLMPAIAWQLEDGRRLFTSINRSLFDEIGYSMQEWVDPSFFDSKIDASDQVSLKLRYGQDSTNSYFEHEFRLFTKQGQALWFRDQATRKEGKVSGFMLRIPEPATIDIAERKFADECRQFVEEAPFAISIYDPYGNLINANLKAAQYWKFPLDEYLGSYNIFRSQIFTDPESLHHIKRAFEGESDELIKKVALDHADGEEKIFRIKYYPILDEHKEIKKVVYISEDISSFLKEKEERLAREIKEQAVLDAMDQAIVITDTDKLVTSYNHKMIEYAGTNNFSLQKKKPVEALLSALHVSDTVHNRILQTITGENERLEHELRLFDSKWFKIEVTHLQGSGGSLIVLQDINTRKEIEIALERSLRKYRGIYNKAPVMMHSVNANGEIISVSDYWLEVLGYERSEVIGKSFSYFQKQEVDRKKSNNFNRLLKGEKLRNIEYQLLKKSGEEIDVLLSSIAETDDKGEFERSMAGMIDITELKQTNKKLSRSRAELLESQRISKIGTFEWDLESNLIEGSPVLSRTMGIDEISFSGDTFYEFLSGDYHADLQKEAFATNRRDKDISLVMRGQHLES